MSTRSPALPTVVPPPSASPPSLAPRRVRPVERRPAWHPSWRSRLLSQGLGWLHRLFGARQRGGLGILMYHRVCPFPPGLPEPTWAVTPQQFERQMTGLLASGFQPWPLRRALDFHRRRERIPRNVFVVTFDDVYACVFHQAWPILRRLEIPATLFLATAYLDSAQPFPSDDWLAAGSAAAPPETWLPISTPQCQEMRASGLIELAAHTHTHADFRDQPQALLEDLKLCQAELKRRFGLTDATFALPYGTKADGFCSPALVQAARQAGMLCSLTTENRLVTSNHDPFDWGRLIVGSHDSPAMLAAQLSGWSEAAAAVSHWLKFLHPLVDG